MRSGRVPTGEIDGELVALDLDKGSCFGMDSIGLAIWELAADPISVGDIAKALTASHEVSREQCLSDLTPFIGDLLAEGLLLRA